MNDVPHRMKLDADYLKIIFGDNAYLPIGLDLNKEDLNIPYELLGLCDYKLSPKE